MKPTGVVIVIAILVLVGGVVWYSRTARAPDKAVDIQPAPQSQGDVVINFPVANQVITSPLHISGKAKGNWFFEASFPVKLVDGNGNTLASAPAQAQGDWQTADYVDFILDLTYSAPTTTSGLLIFSNDNPSGLPENAKSFALPIRFAP